MKRKGVLLACTIMSGISLLIYIVILLIILISLIVNTQIDDSSEFIINLFSPSMIVIVFGVIILHVLAKFSFALFAYLKNSIGFTITTLVLCFNAFVLTCIVAIIAFDVIALLILIYALVELTLLIIGLIQISNEKNKKLKLEELK